MIWDGSLASRRHKRSWYGLVGDCAPRGPRKLNFKKPETTARPSLILQRECRHDTYP